MSNRDWERELADIDRRLAAVPDPGAPTDAVRAPAAPAPPPDVSRRGATPTPGPSRTVGSVAPSGRRSWRAQFALLFRLVLGVAAVAALIYWPYSTRCGVELGYYLGLVALLGLVGIATSTSAWRHRSSVVHLLGLAMLAGALTLAAREVLPKVGYAIPSLAHPASWSCTP
ncbi:hypothetical protein tb265_00890 [Gemmatimonadetes bacterium T265]|nr:hypothetical protein tb265_00890 [Gemmatimonadetes bacterium T265]